MKGFKRILGLVTAGALAVTALPLQDMTAYAASAPSMVDQTVRVLPSDRSTFNDVNSDGFGEFEGWGTSLCWWANRIGYSEEMTQQAADLFFGDEGLDMNIGRYNVGGGDHVGVVTPPEPVVANPKAQIYDLETEGKTPTYEGSSMKVSTTTNFTNAKYTVSDADFGFTKGDAVGDFKVIGYVNSLSDSVGTGDKLHYTVNVAEAGDYTVKLLLMHNSNTTRDVAIRVGGAEGTEYVADNVKVQDSKVVSASGSAQCLFVVTLDGVALAAGENQVEVAGKAGWTLDFAKMLVVKTSDKGVLPAEPEGTEFLHAPHILRSDSAVPGYCVDVTKIKEGGDYSGFDRVDEECGYAWNYDWDADKNQMNILKAAAAASGEDFIAEAFSNSPPYFMTKSGCSSGATDSSKNNLREDSYNAFAAYMADVIVHWVKAGVIDFQSATPMNEPNTSYWGANSDKQEGCHFDPGESQSKIIVAMAKEIRAQAAKTENASIKEKLEKIVYSGTDETSIDTAINSYKDLTEEAKGVVTRIDTHTYGGSKRAELRKLAEDSNVNLWMSEVDGAYTAGSGAGEMTAALGLAQRIMTDLNGMKASTWILWNAVDMHADAEKMKDYPKSKNDFETIEKLQAAVDFNAGYWGIAHGDHNNQEIVLTKKYYGFGQFSKYIRPGACILSSDNSNTLVAFDPAKKQAVIVAINTSADNDVWKFDLGAFKTMGTNIQAIRSSGSLEKGENWADVTENANIQADTAKRCFTADMKANSITTFLVDGVEYDADQDGYKTPDEITLTEPMVSGSAPWTDENGSNGGNTVDKVVDGNLSTFFDGVKDGYVQIDLGEMYEIGAVGYAPRSDYAYRIRGTFYGSNNGEDWTKLYKATVDPPQNAITTKITADWETDSNHYRYIKYATDSTIECNIAEIKLYGTKAELASLITAYEKKAQDGNFVDNEAKTAFSAAIAEAKAVDANASEEVKTAAMAKVVAAYDALEKQEEEWNYTYTSITGVKGAAQYDTEGKRIQAHGGQVQKITYDYDYDENGTIDADEHEFWYWIGEDKTNDYRPCPGIRAYISKDLYNWKDLGNVLKTVADWETFTTDTYFTDLYGDLSEDEQKKVYADLWTDGDADDSGCVIERPKMIYNDETEQYVIWFHADGQTPDSTGGNYAKAKAGVAISDNPAGPFKLLGSYLLNYEEGADHGFDDEVGGHVRDMNLFKDDDGTGYVLYSSDGNQTMHIAKLNADYTNILQPDNSQAEQGVGKDFTRNFIGESREAPAMFKYHGKYYIITSGCTGWGPNRASYAVADHPMGPFTTMGDPCTDADAATTYFTQSTCVIPVDAAKGKFIYMGDRWYNPEVKQGPGAGGSLKDSRYVWVPVEFQPFNHIALRRYSNWTLDELEGKGTYEITTELPAAALSVDDMKAKLPAEITVKKDDDTTETLAVEWSGFPTTERPLGTVTITADVSDGSSFRHSMHLLDEKMIYFFDCAADEADYVDAAIAEESVKLRNTAADQPYAGNGAGFTGKMEVDLGTKNAGADVWAHGYYAMGDKNIEYAFDLGAGTYTVATGYQEWWNTERPTKITVTSGEEELASQEFTLAKTAVNEQQNVTFTLAESATVKVTVSKTGNPDPVMSWIALMQDEKTGEDVALVDKSKLNEQIAAADQLNETDYEAEDWEAFQEIYNSAVELQTKFPVTQAEIDQAAQALKDALAALQPIDKSALNDLLKEAEKLEKDVYTKATWDVFDAAYKKAKKMQSGAAGSQAEVTEMVAELKKAMDALVTIQKKLQDGIAANKPAKAQSAYTAASWNIYAAALKAANDLLSAEGVTEAKVDEAIQTLASAISALQEVSSSGGNTNPGGNENPGDGDNKPGEKAQAKISVKSKIEKAIGSKAFGLGAKVAAGTGKLTYKTSNKKVATVNSSGKVTLKAIGVCTITVSLAESAQYKAATAKVTLTVTPKKVKLSSAKPARGKKLTVKWKKDKTVTGYEIECALKKNFKSGKKSMTVKKASKTSATVTKLKKGKRYYVRVRAYKQVKVGKKTQKIRGSWSNVKLSSKIK